MSYRKVIIFSAPSGSGKTTLIKNLLKQGFPLKFSKSACTRKKRKNEKEGKDYHFLSINEFKQKISENAFVEWEEVYENMFYGTLKSEVEKIWASGNCIIFDVDVVGGIKLKNLFKNNALAIFVSPPSIKTLIKRLKKRATETEENLEKRIKKIHKELKMKDAFDIIIVNEKLEDSFEETTKHVKKFLTP